MSVFRKFLIPASQGHPPHRESSMPPPSHTCSLVKIYWQEARISVLFSFPGLVSSSFLFMESNTTSYCIFVLKLTNKIIYRICITSKSFEVIQIHVCSFNPAGSPLRDLHAYQPGLPVPPDKPAADLSEVYPSLPESTFHVPA